MERRGWRQHTRRIVRGIELLRWVASAEEVPGQKAQGVEIGSAVGLRTVSYLGRCPKLLANDDVGSGQLSAADQGSLGDPKVDDLHVAIQRKHDIGGG